MSKAILLITATLTVQVNFSHAQEGKSKLLRGAGSISCSDIIKFKKNNIDLSGVYDWIYGFWTGLNMSYAESKNGFTRNLFVNLAQKETLELKLLSFCYENLEEPVLSAAIDFYFNLPAEVRINN